MRVEPKWLLTVQVHSTLKMPRFNLKVLVNGEGVQYTKSASLFLS